MKRLALIAPLLVLVPSYGAAQSLDHLLEDVTGEVEASRKLTQVMVDKIFSFSELGFQEYETSAYITSILRENGFEVEEGIAGIPTA